MGDAVLRVFDLRSGEEVAHSKGHAQDILTVAVSACNRFVASAGRDKKLLIVRMPTDEECAEEPKEKENEKDGQSREMRVLDSWTPYMTERAIRCVDFSPY